MGKLVIAIATAEYIRQRTMDIAAGRLVPNNDDPKVWVSSLESIGRLLSNDNYAMIDVIRSEQPETISMLARLIGREQGNVSRTLTRLADFHIIEFIEKNGKKQPVVWWDEIRIMPMSQAA